MDEIAGFLIDDPDNGCSTIYLSVIWGVGIDSDSPFTRQINDFNGIAVISGLLVGAECAISAAIARWRLSACSVSYHRRVCLILRTLHLWSGKSCYVQKKTNAGHSR